MEDKKYTIGLDIGTASVGWAVVDDNFNLVQGKKRITEIGKNGKVVRKRRSRINLWGVRLFDEGETAEDRRLKRAVRRRLERRKRRLRYLREIFHDEITKFDENFFIRMNESFYQNDDDIKKIKTQYPFFNGIRGVGETYVNEKEYYEKYPTIYHLRQRLMENKEQADLRLVYLAMHHILKFRGHFINQGHNFTFGNATTNVNILELLKKFNKLSEFDFKFSSRGEEEAKKILINSNFSKQKKALELTRIFSVFQYKQNFDTYNQGTMAKTKKYLENEDAKQKALYAAIVGGGIDLATIFANEKYKPTGNNAFLKPGKFKYSDENFDHVLLELEPLITDEEFEILKLGKGIFESVVLSNILTEETVSTSMIEKYNLHSVQLTELKEFTKSISSDFYAKFFKEDGIYTKYIKGSGNPQRRTTREVFYKEIKKTFEAQFKNVVLEEDKQAVLDIINIAIDFENYLPKQRMSDNGAIPYQMHEYELVKMIENQKVYYPFLAQTVEIGNKESKLEYKIQALMKFKIPYYIGPLTPATKGKEGNQKSDKSKFAWMQKKIENVDKKITPWNFDEVVDKETSATEFIERMTSLCSYLPDEKVMPKNSLLYQEYLIYNELIVSGWYEGKEKKYFSANFRQKIVDKLFKHNKKVTANQMMKFLNQEIGLNLNSSKQLFGIDIFVKESVYSTTFSTYIDLIKAGINEHTIDENRKKFEEIIKWQTIFADPKILKKKIQQTNEEWGDLLTSEQIQQLSKKHYTGWGHLCEKLLNGIRAENGKTIIENLKEEPFRNFRRLLEDEKIAQAIKNVQTEKINTDKINYNMIKNLSGSPTTKKGIWQSLKIIKELEAYLGREKIGKIVLEMANGDSITRSISRGKQIENYYKTFLDEIKNENLSKSNYSVSEFKKTVEEFENKKEMLKLNDEKVYLYFMQNAKCMYSGTNLKLADLSSYEVDHIIPQTYIKDDSLDNKVLVLRTENQNKGCDVPNSEIISKMNNYWELLAKNRQVSTRKLVRLRTGKLTDKTKEGLINRQLVETRKITKHVANILATYFEKRDVEILIPKSDLISQFRNGLVYIQKEEFAPQEILESGMSYEIANIHIFPDGTEKESEYSNSNFVKVHFHEGFKKNRNINDYHHAHDAYLSVIVATYVYETHPELKNIWVYGKSQKKVSSKHARKRKDFMKQLLTGMVDEIWSGYDIETGKTTKEWQRDDTLNKIRKNLSLRNISIVRKTEVQLGKFGDESIYKKDETAENFSKGLKKNLNPKFYGGTKAPISAFTVIIKNVKKEIKPLSISAVWAKNYIKASDKVKFLNEIYPKQEVSKVVVEKVAKYSRYNLKNNVPRLVASYQEAKSGTQLPIMNIATKYNSTKELENTYLSLSKFIQQNQLLKKDKSKLLKTKMKKNFDKSTVEEKVDIINEMVRITKGQNQQLKALQKAGLQTSLQQLKSGNTISAGVTLIYQSTTGLYETRRRL